MSSPPAKCQRTEDAPITRSDIWYQDGSVVLQAQDTQFRVHWGNLCQHSSFFREMQGLPQPPDLPSVDGCPIIELQDAVLDVEHLLKVLYNPTFLLQKALPFPVVSALIRLGRKYHFSDLLDAAVERLTFENPTTLEEYDALPESGKTTRIIYYPGLRYDTLTVARENNIQSVLPCAYYCALFHPQKRLFDGIPREDGTSAFLASVDQCRCVLGREALIKAQAQRGYTLGWLCSWWDGDDSNCTNIPRCLAVRTIQRRKYHEFLGLWALSRSPFSSGTYLCASCREHREKSCITGRKKIWEDLPSFFDLPPWGELKNDL